MFAAARRAPPRDYAYYAGCLRGRPAPLAYCDLELFDANARALASKSGGLPIRVATKSIRCRALLERVLGTDGFAGLLCFDPREASWLSQEGFTDLLVAYPVMQPDALDQVAARVAAGARIVLTADDPIQVDAAAAAAGRHGCVLELCLDLDVSSQFPGIYFGVRRSPIRTPAAAVALARHIERTGGVQLVGAQAYEAQIAGIPDAVPGKRAMNTALRWLKRRSMAEVIERRSEVVSALERAGVELRFVNGGGSGSLAETSRDPSVTELSAGSGLFGPALFDRYRSWQPAPAVGFALEVVRRPAPDIVTCFGGGYVASGAAGSDRLPVPYLPAGARLLAHEGAGEVQTPVEYRGPVALEPGDLVFFRHAKAGEMCERFDRLWLLQARAAVGEAPTYRGEGHTFS